MYLVLLETSGNQRYIFSTNKLRENVGASELTYKIGTSVVSELINENTQIKPIITTSGKALLLADDEDAAKKVVREVTKKALTDMPGLTINGAICKVTDCEKPDKSDEAEKLHQAVGNVHKRLEEIRYQIPSNLQRFQRIPFVAECASSNLPAQEVKVFYENRREVERKIFSQTVSAKRNALVTSEESATQDETFTKSRIVKMLADNFQVKLFDDLEELEKNFKKKADWFAVIHADGNGLGQIFLDFGNYADMSSSENYKKSYKEFSDEIDVCTQNAFGKALQKLQEKFRSYQIPVVPLILGGDDLTFICDGEFAINLTKDFLRNFEIECLANEVIKKITGEIKLGICAGIAIIKPNFPFHQAYHLAEELLQSAKKTKKISPSLSAFDYHVLYDSSGTTLDEIREKTPFVARPYIVTPKETAKSYTTDVAEQTWIENHHFCELAKRVKAMTAKDNDEKNKLPNSQLHLLREGLYVAEKTESIQKEVDARAKLIAHRYASFKDLFVKDETLFFDGILSDKNDDEENTKRTHFLDALDIVEFWK